MKKIFILFIALAMVLCLVSCTNKKTNTNQTYKTIGELYDKCEPVNSGSSGNTFKCAYFEDGKLYVAQATMTDEQLDKLSSLDLFSEAYNEEYDKIVKALAIVKTESMEQYRLTKEKLNSYIGKTGKAMLDDGFFVTGYSYDTELVDMANKAFVYVVTFEGLVLNEEDEPSEVIKNYVITKIEYSGISNFMIDD